DSDTHFTQHFTHGGKADSHYGMVVTGNLFDEPAAATVNGESARDSERLTAGDVSVDFLIRNIGKEHRGADRDSAGSIPGNDPVPRMQNATLSPHHAPAFTCPLSG